MDNQKQNFASCIIFVLERRCAWSVKHMWDRRWSVFAAIFCLDVEWVYSEATGKWNVSREQIL
jgi:hypothetical protein